MTTEAVPAIYEMEHWGCPFSRFADGTIAQRPFGGAGFPRTCYAADMTGHVPAPHAVRTGYRHEVKIYVERFVAALCVDDGGCHGVVA